MAADDGLALDYLLASPGEFCSLKGLLGTRGGRQNGKVPPVTQQMRQQMKITNDITKVTELSSGTPLTYLPRSLQHPRMTRSECFFAASSS